MLIKPILYQYLIKLLSMKVAVIQIAPFFLNKRQTWEKLKQNIKLAASQDAKLVTWGETLIPGYPQWLSPSGGAQFNDQDQKIAYRKYWEEAMTLDDPIIEEMKSLSEELQIMMMGGITERSSGSIYATLITIKDGKLLGRHRKIKPTYEERLVWADGDSKGLVTHDLGEGLMVGGLNCWENWLPYTRATLHRQNEMVHVAVWPGSDKLTTEISRFIALEGRYWVISASGLLRDVDFEHLTSEEFPQKTIMQSQQVWQNGGSMIVNPKGEVIAGPLLNEEGILYADIDRKVVIEERQNLDYSGHYSRPDIFDLQVK